MISMKKNVSKFAPLMLMLAASCAAGAQTEPVNERPEVARKAVALDALELNEHAAQLESLRSQLEDHSSLLRVQTMQTLGASITVDAETANAILQDGVEDRDPVVAEAALLAFLLRGDEQMAQVRAMDLSHFSGETRELAEVRLSSLSDDRSTLCELMKNGDAQVQQAAFDALAATDTTQAIDTLTAEFRDTTSLFRLQTLELLLRSPYTNSPAIAGALLEKARRDDDPLVQAFAVKALDEKN